MIENNDSNILSSLKDFVFNNSSDFIVIADAETGRFLEANPSALEKSGYSREELLALTISDIDPALASLENWTKFKEILIKKNHLLFEGSLKSKNGSLLPVEVNASRVEKQGYSYIIAIARDITTRKSTEKEMRIFMEIADNANYGVALMDMDGKIIYSNRYFSDVHGYEPDEILNNNIMKLCKGTSSMSPTEIFNMAVRDGKYEPMEMVHVRKDGDCFPALASGVIVHDENGNPQYLACTSIDITNRVLDEMKLKESSELHKTLVESAPDAIYSLDADGTYLSLNPAAAAYFGKAPSEMVGKNIKNFYPEPVAERMIQNITNIINSGESLSLYNIPYPTAVGTFIFDTTLSPINNSDGIGEYVIGISRNMTARFTAIEGLKNSEERLRNIFSASPEFIILTDTKFQIKDANETFLEWAGIEREDILGTNMLDFTGHASRFRLGDAVKKMSESGTVKGLSALFSNSAGVTCGVELNCTTMSPNGKEVEFLFIGRDISERLRSEEEKEALREQLLHSQKMEAVGTLAGGIAHDFNNLLSVIRGNADISLLRLTGNKESSDYLKKSIKAMDKARELTSNLLTFSRKEKPRMITVPILSVISETISLLDRTVPKNIKINFNDKLDSSRIEADVNQLQQALLNILINAIDAMPDGGTIDISSHCEFIEQNNPVTAPGLNPGNYCVVKIADTGTGIPQYIINKVMEPFFTTKAPGKGTGLGLSITHSIISNHKGEVVISSKDGEGTTISLYLPSLSESEVENSLLVQEQETTGKVIYIVDDDADFADMISDALDISGFKPLVAPLGIEGIETFRKLKDEIDLILIDIQMPEMNGEQYLEKIFEIKPETKALLCSGMRPVGKGESLLSECKCGFIQKPFNINELCDSIVKELKRKSPI